MACPSGHGGGEAHATQHLKCLSLSWPPVASVEEIVRLAVIACSGRAEMAGVIESV
ncbi:hypothetical protein ACFL4L_06840 [bacterium]